jgi:hypothetical protein
VITKWTFYQWDKIKQSQWTTETLYNLWSSKPQILLQFIKITLVALISAIVGKDGCDLLSTHLIASPKYQHQLFIHRNSSKWMTKHNNISRMQSYLTNT